MAEELPQRSADHVDHPIAQTGRKVAAQNGNDRKQKGHRDDAQGRHTKGQHLLACRKQAQQLPGKQQEHRRAAQGKDNPRGQQYLPGLLPTAGLFAAVIVPDHRDGCLPQPVDWHHQEVLQFIVNAKEGHGRGRNTQQNSVDRKGRHAADGLHHNGGQAYPVDVLHILPQESVALQPDVDDWVLHPVEPQRGCCTDELADDRSNGRAPNAHGRAPQQAKDRDRVQNDVDHRTDDERNHGQHRVPHCLQQPLAVGLQKNPPAEHKIDRQILSAQLLHLRLPGQGAGDLRGEQQPHHRKHQRRAQHQKQTGGGGTAGFRRLFLAQPAGKQGVQAHRRPHANGDHQKLDGIHQRVSGQCRFGQARHKNAVWFHNLLLFCANKKARNR